MTAFAAEESGPEFARTAVVGAASAGEARRASVDPRRVVASAASSEDAGGAEGGVVGADTWLCPADSDHRPSRYGSVHHHLGLGLALNRENGHGAEIDDVRVNRCDCVVACSRGFDSCSYSCCGSWIDGVFGSDPCHYP